jgi:hypothetical protein
MNKVTCCFAVGLLLAGLACGSSDEGPLEPLPGSLKGYDLFSWRSQSVGEEWCFTLITGTNRWKMRSEIGPPDQALAEGWVEVSVCDPALLERTLSRLRKGEWVSWNDGRFVENDAPTLPSLAFPDDVLIHRITASAAAIGIDFHVNR